jgi:WD40 repeat protein
MWNATTGQRIRTFGADGQPADQIAVSNDGAFVAGATQNGSVAAWDSDTGEQRWALRRDEPILDLAMGSGQHLVAVSGETGDVRIYDRSGRQVYELDEGADRTVWSLAFTADGRYLAVSSSRDQPGPGADRVRIWDLEQREVVQEFDPGPGGIDFDPAGDGIVTARAGVGGIWDVEEGEQLVRLTGHTGDIYETAFSNDGALVATASYDGTVRVWDATSGTQRLVLRGHDAIVTEVAFSPDGSRLVSGADGTVRVWALDLDDLIAIAQDEVTRQLTDEECREYLHLDECPGS